MILGVIYLALAYASDLPYTLFNKTNDSFSQLVYGSSNHTMWAYVDTLFLQEGGSTAAVVSILNNTFDYKLSLHYIHAVGDSSDRLGIDQHTMARSEEEPAENDTITRVAA